MARTLSALAACVLFAAACGPAAGSGSATSGSVATGPAASDQTRPSNAVVTHVVDGDTIDATIDGVSERIRLIGIDTPETKKPNTPIQCFGPEASAYTTMLLPIGTPVYLERDQVGRDDYGRLLAYVYRSSDGLFVNLDIVAGGFAKPLTIAPNNAYADQFVDAARLAERANIGLWASCSG